MSIEKVNFDPHAAPIRKFVGDPWDIAEVQKYHRYDDALIPRLEFTPVTQEDLDAALAKAAEKATEIARKNAEFEAIIKGDSVER